MKLIFVDIVRQFVSNTHCTVEYKSQACTSLLSFGTSLEYVASASANQVQVPGRVYVLSFEYVVASRVLLRSTACFEYKQPSVEEHHE